MFARCERHLCQPDEYKTSTFTRDTATARLLIQILYTHMSSIRSDNDGCLDFENVLRIVRSVSWNTKLSFGLCFRCYGVLYIKTVFSLHCAGIFKPWLSGPCILTNASLLPERLQFQLPPVSEFDHKCKKQLKF